MKARNKRFLLLAAGLALLATMGVFAEGQGEDSNKIGPVYNEYSGTPAKYVFLFIGDGMGLPQVSAAEIYSGSLSSKTPDAPRVLSFTKFPAQGITTTHDAESFIPDSASTGTSIACGYKTLGGIVSMDPEKKIKYTSIARQAKDMGMKVGIVSSVSIDHATPAVFYSNVPSRGMMYEISLQLADSGFDYFGGGSIADPDGARSKMENKPGNAFDYARNRGYTIADSKSRFNALKPGAGKVWAITETPADGKAMLFEIDRPSGTLSLADFTRKGVELMDNPQGFFLMVEGGKIDWAGHANDAAANIRDVFAFDDAVKVAVDFAKQHPEETLIVVTGDHECGGMTIGFAGTKYSTFFTKLDQQKISYVKFTELLGTLKKDNPNATFEQTMPLITEYFGLTNKGDGSEMDLTPYELTQLRTAFVQSMKDAKLREKDDATYLLYGGYEPLTVTLTHILNRKAGIAWTSYSHTGVPVPTYAYGVGQSLFNGYYDNTDIYRKMAAVMGITSAVASR